MAGAIAFMIAKMNAEAEETVFVMVKVMIVTGEIATMMHMAIFAHGVDVFMTHKAILYIQMNDSLVKS